MIAGEATEVIHCPPKNVYDFVLDLERPGDRLGHTASASRKRLPLLSSENEMLYMVIEHFR